MSISILCPECGGIVGAKTITDEGKPCICFSQSDFKTVLESADRQVEPPEAKAKICCQCGMDLTGKGRLRDQRGYWCKVCHKADKEANRQPGVRCPDCGRHVLETALHEFDGLRICGLCRADRRKARENERKYRVIGHDGFDENSKTSVYWLMGVVGVLVLIIFLHLIGVLT